MLHARRQADAQVAEAVHAAEHQIEAALLSAANLITVISAARQSAKLSMAFGHDAIVRAGVTTQTLIAARGDILATHAELAQVRRQMGLVMDGGDDFGGNTKPPSSGAVLPPTTLKAVPAAA